MGMDHDSARGTTNGRRSMGDDPAVRRGTDAMARTDEVPATPVQLGRLVRARRSALGLSQAELAHKIGTSRYNVARIEEGQHPNPEVLRRLVASLGAESVPGQPGVASGRGLATGNGARARRTPRRPGVFLLCVIGAIAVSLSGISLFSRGGSGDSFDGSAFGNQGVLGASAGEGGNQVAAAGTLVGSVAIGELNGGAARCDTGGGAAGTPAALAYGIQSIPWIDNFANYISIQVCGPDSRITTAGVSRGSATDGLNAGSRAVPAGSPGGSASGSPGGSPSTHPGHSSGGSVLGSAGSQGGSPSLNPANVLGGNPTGSAGGGQGSPVSGGSVGGNIPKNPIPKNPVTGAVPKNPVAGAGNAVGNVVNTVGDTVNNVGSSLGKTLKTP